MKFVWPSVKEFFQFSYVIEELESSSVKLFDNFDELLIIIETHIARLYGIIRLWHFVGFGCSIEFSFFAVNGLLFYYFAYGEC